MLVLADVVGFLPFILLLPVFMPFPLCTRTHFLLVAVPVALISERPWLFPAASEVLLLFVAWVTTTCSFVVFVISFFFVMHFFRLLSEKYNCRYKEVPHRNFIYGRVGRMFVRAGRYT